MSAKRCLIILLLLFSASHMVFGSEENDSTAAGRMILSLERHDNNLIATGVKIVEGAEPIPLQEGGYCISIQGSDGRELFSRNIILPDEILYDYLDATGKLRGGRVRKSDSFCLVLPNFIEARTIEIRSSGGSLLLQQEIGEIPLLGNKHNFSSRPAGVEGNGPELGEYLRVITRDSRPLADKDLSIGWRDAQPSAKSKAKGRITIPGVVDYSLVELNLTFYERESGKEVDKIQIGGQKGGKLGSDGSFSIRVSPGEYVVAANCVYFDPDYQGRKVQYPPDPLFVDLFDPGKDELNLAWGPNNLFRGRVMEKGGRSIRAEIWIFETKLGKSTWDRWLLTVVQTDNEGNFAARLPNKKLVFVVIPNSQETSGEIIKIVKVRKRQQQPFKFVCRKNKKRGGPQLQRIWGEGSSEGKLNILMMPEAYTEYHETFTDKNGNGVWDGDLFLDANLNGKYDEGEDYYDRNWDGDYDAPEPFVDENGDGICNRYERAEFEFLCAYNAQVLLNFAPFDRFSDRIHIYTCWIPSEDGNHTFVDLGLQNSTVFNMFQIGAKRYQGGAGSTARVYEVAAEAFPNFTIPVVWIHDPFSAMKGVGSYNFGRIVLSSQYLNTRGGGNLIHELGHGVGNLWDEYIYYDYLDYFDVPPPTEEPDAANATIETDPRKVKWAGYIKGNPPVPTPYRYEGYGLFKGMDMWEEGLYRPTYTSMMRDAISPFFKVNEKALIKVLKQFRK